MLGLVNNNRDKIYMQHKTRVEFEGFIFHKDKEIKIFGDVKDYFDKRTILSDFSTDINKFV